LNSASPKIKKTFLITLQQFCPMEEPMDRHRYAPHIVRAVLALYISAAASCATSLEQTGPVEVENEPRHHVVFENLLVRILEVNIPVGAATLYHRHRRDNLPVIQSDAEVTNQVLGEPKSPVRTVTPGRMVLARASGEGYVHQVTNVGNTPFRGDRH
jgi:hypothetical protein